MRKLAPAAAVAPVAAVVLLSLLALSGASQAASAPSPWVGSWTLDAASSKVAPNRPTGLLLHFTQADAALIKYTFSFTTAQGQQITSSYAGKPDGKPHPVTIDGQQVAQASYTWSSPRALRGKVSANGTEEELELDLSADGKTINEIRRTKAPAPSEETLVFRKK